MNKPAYDFVSTPDKLRCIFTSEGIVQIKKIILFYPVQDNSEMYELAFGDLVDNKFVDYYSVTNNQDMEKIIGTVINAIHSFFDTYADKTIFFKVVRHREHVCIVPSLPKISPNRNQHIKFMV
jgi:hypothetical protein